MKEKRDTRKLNPEVKEFQPRRSERKAKETARNRVVGIALNELKLKRTRNVLKLHFMTL